MHLPVDRYPNTKLFILICITEDIPHYFYVFYVIITLHVFSDCTDLPDMKTICKSERERERVDLNLKFTVRLSGISFF